MVHRLDRVPPPAALDAFLLLVFEKPWIGPEELIMRQILNNRQRAIDVIVTNPAYETSPMV